MFNLFKKRKIKKKMEQYEFIKESLIEFALTEYEPDDIKKRQSHIEYHNRVYHVIFNQNGDATWIRYSQTPVHKFEIVVPPYAPYYSANFEDTNYAIFTSDGKTRHASECYNHLNESYGTYK